MKEKQASNPSSTTFTYVSNYLAARVSELPDYAARNRNISLVVTSQEEAELAPTSGVLRPDGTVFVGHYPNWSSLSQEERNKVNNERGKKPKKNGGKGKTRRREFRKLRRVINKSKRQIAALQKHVGNGQDTEEREVRDSGEAGDQFGGKRTKKNKD